MLEWYEVLHWLKDGAFAYFAGRYIGLWAIDRRLAKHGTSLAKMMAEFELAKMLDAKSRLTAYGDRDE